MTWSSIAQAERMYYTQNGSYADLPTLSSTGTMNITRTSRDGYTYSAAAFRQCLYCHRDLHRAARGESRRRYAAALPDIYD